MWIKWKWKWKWHSYSDIRNVGYKFFVYQYSFTLNWDEYDEGNTKYL